jgi:hypothetical protein
MNDPIETLEEILKRNGCDDVNLRENEADRYFLFDQISEPNDLELAWSQFPAHREIRARAAEVDAVSDIVPGWGYRTPKKSHRCSDAELIELVGRHIAVIRPFITDWSDVRAFIDRGFDIEVIGRDAGAPPDATDNELFGAWYESISDFKIERYPYEEPILEVLDDWATYLTKCDEVALYLSWPVLKNVETFDPATPLPGFKLWQYNCRTNYWIDEGDMNSRLVCIQRPW